MTSDLLSWTPPDSDRHGVKHCAYCDRDLPLASFSQRRASADGLSYKCRKCQRAYSGQHYRDNGAHYAELSANWKAANPERAAAYQKRHRIKRGQKQFVGVRPYFKKHGMYLAPEYRIWLAIKQRCLNPKNTKFHLYGGKGVSICAEWNSFENFMRDMGLRPSPAHSIDRIDSNGSYCATNCRWATPTEQNRNTTRNRPITVGGVTLLLCEWAEKINMNQKTLAYRLKLGWSPERAISEPLHLEAKRR